MLVRIFNLCALVLLLAIPLYGSKKPMMRMKKPANTAAEHRADLAKLTILPKQEYLVSGTGAPRAEFVDCNRDLPGFEKVLVSKGLSPVERIKCVLIEGERNTYAPAFRALASEEVEASIELGGRYNSQSFCEFEIHRMVADFHKRKVPVLEWSCKRVSNSELSLATDELFQPAIVVLTKPMSL